LSPTPLSTLFPYTTLFRSFFDGLCEDRELRAAEDLGDVHRLDRIAQVRLVAPIHRHRIVVRDARERRGRDGPVGELAIRSRRWTDRKSTRLNSSHVAISYA